MNLSPNYLKRYKEIAQLFWKYGRSDLVKQMGIDEAVDPQVQIPEFERLKSILRKSKPLSTGQMGSSQFERC